jgi:hypothetical protein
MEHLYKNIDILNYNNRITLMSEQSTDNTVQWQSWESTENTVVTVLTKHWKYCTVTVLISM